MATEKISDIYRRIRQDRDPQAALRKYSFEGLTPQEIAAHEAKGRQFYRGKVRDLLIDQRQIEIIHSDRLTAFDKFIAMVPCKGTILTAISNYWLDVAKTIVPTHLISRPADRVLLVERCEPFKIEVVVRGYLAGSMARAYAKGERLFCGERLVDGLKEYDKLPEVIITPTTKAAVFEHDEDTTAKDLIAAGVCTEKQWAQIHKMALQVFQLGTEVNARQGWILVDTKYEFGRGADGEVRIIDEVHTPDSSRFWVSATYKQRVAAGQAPEMLDKENVRRWLMQNGYKGEGPVPNVPADVLLSLGETYLKVAEALIGEPVLAKT